MESVVSVDPFQCKAWKLHNRLEEHVNEESCRDEIISFLEHGQLVPALGRRVRTDIGDMEIEVICGVRRMFIARHLNKPLLIEIKDLSDHDAIVAMDLENRQRQDVSPYERGIGYARWLRNGYFESQEKLAMALRVSPAHVSRLLKLARLPSVVVAAFGSGVDICEGWGLQLAAILENPGTAQRVLKIAREIGAEGHRPPPREVYRQLISSSVHGKRPRKRDHDTVIKDGGGIPMFRIRHQRRAITLVLPVEKISELLLQKIQGAVVKILQEAAPAGERVTAPGKEARTDSVHL